MKTFMASVWTNGKPDFITGSGFGIRIPQNIWLTMSNEKWTNVEIIAGSETFIIDITDSFWRKCHEIRCSKIGKYLIKIGLKEWKKGQPPKILIEVLRSKCFKLRGIKIPPLVHDCIVD